MKRLYIIGLILPVFLTGCNTNSEITVEYSGALREIMSGNIMATKSLRELKDIKDVYALGAMENLKGEIQIFKGEVFNSYVSDSIVLIANSYDHKASLLVYSDVKDWEAVEVPSDITTKVDLEEFVYDIANEKGISIEEPFPFLISGVVQSLSWHVINWAENDKEHTHEKHKLSGLNGVINNNTVEIIGFYSDKHKGVFTHHSTNIHLHFRTDEGKLAGHVDDLTPGDQMILKLPKNDL